MKLKKKLSNAEIADFCSQLSYLLPTGITPYECIHLLSEDTMSAEGKNLLAFIESQLKNGETFHTALEASGVFPNYVVSMVLLGEESGNLDVIIKKLAQYYEQQCNIHESIKNAITYPLIMVGLMLVILVVLLTTILPIFNQVFIQLGSGLSGVSQKLMNIGYMIQSISGLIIIFFFFICIAFFSVKKLPKLHTKLLHFIHTNKLTKNFFLDMAYAKFANALSLITAGGIDIYKGLELASNLIDNEELIGKTNICKQSLSDGNYIYEAVKEAQIFQVQHQRMIQIGYRSGKLEDVLTKISEYYENVSLNRIQKILGAIEPTLVIIFSLMVGLILLSVIMPLISLMSSIG